MTPRLCSTPQDHPVPCPVCHQAVPGQCLCTGFPVGLEQPSDIPAEGVEPFGGHFHHGDPQERSRSGPDEGSCGLNDEEVQAVYRAAVPFLLHDGFLPSFQDFLFYHFRGCNLALARKLARLSHRQVEALYQSVKRLGVDA